MGPGTTALLERLVEWVVVLTFRGAEGGREEMQEQCSASGRTRPLHLFPSWPFPVGL